MTADPNPSQQEAPPTSLGGKLPSPDGTGGTAAFLPPARGNLQSPAYTGIELWLHRITVLMFVFVCAAVGVLLVIAPWRAEWTDNRLLLIYPGLREVVENGFVRGLCSGLGVLDIWIGFWEAVHYHEERRP